MTPLERYRIAKGLSISELSRVVGYSQPYTWQLCRGDRAMSLNAALRIEKRTGIALRTLIATRRKMA